MAGVAKGKTVKSLTRFFLALHLPGFIIRLSRRKMERLWSFLSSVFFFFFVKQEPWEADGEKRIITPVVSYETLHPISPSKCIQVSYANCHTRTQWNWIRSDATIPSPTGCFDNFACPCHSFLFFFPYIVKREMFILKRSNVSPSFDAFIWKFIMMLRYTALPIQTVRNKKAGIARNGFANNRKKDVNEKSGISTEEKRQAIQGNFQG